METSGQARGASRKALGDAAEQAAVGGGLTLEVPVFFPCETCRGRGTLDGPLRTMSAPV